jgi:hypothetical protein
MVFSDIPMSYSWSLLIAGKSRPKWRMVRSVGYSIDFCNDFGEQILVTTECCCFICFIWRICAMESRKGESEQATLAPLIGSSIQSATGVEYNITGGKDITLQEVNRVSQVLEKYMRYWFLLFYILIKEGTS